MLPLRLPLVLLILAAPLPALAQVGDAGPGDGGVGDAAPADAGAGCGAITPEGECQGNVVVYCNEDVVERIDCPVDWDPTAQCIEIDPSYGVDCAVAVGEACLFLDENGDYFQSFCQGTQAGCIETPEDVVCEANAGACTETDIDRCFGDRLMTDCAVNQPYFVDCAAYGGTCSEGACRGIPNGGFCEPSILLCADGTECRPTVLDPDLTQCATVASPDAGVPTANDAGVADTGSAPPAPPPEDSGCRAVAVGQGSPLGLLFLGLALMFRRRR